MDVNLQPQYLVGSQSIPARSLSASFQAPTSVDAFSTSEPLNLAKLRDEIQMLLTENANLKAEVEALRKQNEYPKSATVEVLNAWYGVENGPKMNVTHIMKHGLDTRSNLAVPASTNEFFGQDPVPGVKKVTALHIRSESHLRIPEGTSWAYSPSPVMPTMPIAASSSFAPNQSTFSSPDLAALRFELALMKSRIEVVSAWYGLDNGERADVTLALKQFLERNGFIAISPNTNKFFVIDPVPGFVKVSEVHIRQNGRDMHLRTPEGELFVYPPHIEPTRVNQAISEWN